MRHKFKNNQKTTSGIQHMGNMSSKKRVQKKNKNKTQHPRICSRRENLVFQSKGLPETQEYKLAKDHHQGIVLRNYRMLRTKKRSQKYSERKSQMPRVKKKNKKTESTLQHIVRHGSLAFIIPREKFFRSKILYQSKLSINFKVMCNVKRRIFSDL